MRKIITCLTIIMLILCLVSQGAYAQFGSALYGKIIGFVIDENGKPVEKATVKVMVKGGKEGKTDKNGKFKLVGRVGSSKSNIFSGKETTTIKEEPVEVFIVKEGYKPFQGFVYPYYAKLAKSSGSKISGLIGGLAGLGGGGADTGYVYVTPVVLVPSGTDKVSDSLSTGAFLQLYFTFENVEYSPQVVQKGNVSFKGVLVLPPDPGLKIDMFLVDQTNNKRHKMGIKKEKDKVTGIEKQIATKNIGLSGPDGLKVFSLELVVENKPKKSSFLGKVGAEISQDYFGKFGGMAFVNKRESGENLYVYKCKDDAQCAAGEIFLGGMGKLSQQDVQGAVQEFHRAEEVAPGHQLAYYGLKKAYVINPEETTEELFKLMDEKKDFAEGWAVMGDESPDNGHSVALLKEAIKIKPDNNRYHNLLGLRYEYSELYSYAVKEYETVVALEKKSKKKEHTKEAQERIKNFKKYKLQDNPSKLSVDTVTLDDVRNHFQKQMETTKRESTSSVQENPPVSDSDKKETAQPETVTPSESSLKEQEGTPVEEKKEDALPTKEETPLESTPETVKAEEVAVTETKPTPEDKKETEAPPAETDKKETPSQPAALPLKIMGATPKKIFLTKQQEMDIKEGDIVKVVRGDKTVATLKISKISDKNVEAEVIDVTQGESVDFDDVIVK